MQMSTLLKWSYEMWLSAVNETLAETMTELTGAEEALAVLPAESPQVAKARGLLAGARYNCEFVGKGAGGAHNPGYALELLDKAMSDVAEAVRIVRQPGTAGATSR